MEVSYILQALPVHVKKSFKLHAETTMHLLALRYYKQHTYCASIGDLTVCSASSVPASKTVGCTSVQVTFVYMLAVVAAA
jgi:hypothetical protein